MILPVVGAAEAGSWKQEQQVFERRRIIPAKTFQLALVEHGSNSRLGPITSSRGSARDLGRS